MRKRMYRMYIIMMLCFLLLCSCRFPEEVIAPTSAQPTITVSPSPTVVPKETATPSSTPEPTATPVPTPDIVVSGEGLTYIDGILVVNKTYSLPKSYHPGADDTALQAFAKMKAAAAKDGISLKIVSGYRSYSTQDYLYHSYAKEDGVEKADTYSARPGHSEHQTGLAFDINDASDRFIGSPAAVWLAEHCHEYGFVVRYPQGKQEITGFKYEPWHVRYLGIPLAGELTASGLCLEEFLHITSRYPDRPV